MDFINAPVGSATPSFITPIVILTYLRQGFANHRETSTLDRKSGLFVIHFEYRG